MWQYLRQHPDIWMPETFGRKEPSFYCDTWGMEKRRKYLALFAGAGARKMVGEASGPYLTSPESPGLIAADAPDAKFIIMLRNPAERAFSLFKRMRDKGFESVANFREAIALEEQRVNDPEFQENCRHYFRNFFYFHTGLYAAQVKRFMDHFGRDHVHIIIFEEFSREPARFVRGAYAFLGVDATFEPDIKIHNASTDETPLALDVRQELLTLYRADIETLSTLLRRDLASIWK